MTRLIQKDTLPPRMSCATGMKPKGKKKKKTLVMEQKVHLFKYLSEQRVAEGCNAVGDAGADECA